MKNVKKKSAIKSRIEEVETTKHIAVTKIYSA